MDNWFQRTLDEEYQLVRVLKRSDDGDVFQLRHKELGRDIIRINHTGSADVYNLLKRYSHKNIARIYEVHTSGSSVTVLEEYIDGMTVGEVLQTGLYTENGVRKIAAQLCDALEFVHSIGIVHRDIKPENIIITSDGTVKLIDWNAARIHKKYISSDTTTMGTTGYAAPEQYGITQSDSRADIYSVGILMNVMLTGDHPSKKMCTGSLAKVIKKCTDIQPDRRYQTAAELRKQI
ncbi:MAG: serine/threonine protein kinase [Ruminococcaceae bacterium]|nr:serine/threonine protein kinase [Oscillospiraceae bacterium]